jgi:S-adenosylmethionine hydrolase
MEPSKIISLLTDFGRRDTYVGQMKGAILAVAPDARLVDLCHDVPAHDVRSGAYLLETGYEAFPEGTVHVAVVDPGVGTERRMLGVRAGGHCFLAPDNGLLTRVLEREKLVAAHVLQNRSLFGPRESMTFAGRDVFAPAAAWLVRGVDLQRLGPPAGDLTLLDEACPRVELGRPVRVPVLHVDHFGNVVLDVRVETLTAVLGHPPAPQTPMRLVAEGGQVTRFLETYGQASGTEPFFLINSAGYLEVAVDSGRADDALALRAGTHPELKVGR